MTRRDQLATYGWAVPAAIAGAAVLLALVWLPAYLGGGSTIQQVRGLSLAALLVWSLDASESAGLAAAQPDAGLAERASFAGREAMVFVILMVIFIGLEDANDWVLGIVTALGLGLGLWRARAPGAVSRTGRVAARYDMGQADGWSGLYRGFVLLWPAVAALLVLPMMAFPPEGGWRGGYVYYQAVLLIGLCPRYPVRRDVPLWLSPVTAKAVGLVLLIGAILQGYLAA